MLNPLSLLRKGPRPIPAGAPVILFPLLRDVVHLEPDDILARLRARTALRYDVTGDPPERSGNVITFGLDDEVAAVALMPMQLPWSDLEGPCATAWWWPEATYTCEHTTAHQVVTCAGGHDDLVGRMLRLTDLTAAVVEASGAVAVYCGSGTLVQPAHNFLRTAARAGRDALPLHLWIDFRIQEVAPATFFLATTGLALFGHYEVECITRRPREVAHDRVFNFANHLLRGPAEGVKPGSSWSVQPGEAIQVKRAPSQWGRGPVYRLVFPGEEGRK